MVAPSRGEIWLVDLSPVRGHEPAGRRPALVISVDEFNHGPAGLVHVIPLTTKERGIPLHVEVRLGRAEAEELREVRGPPLGGQGAPGGAVGEGWTGHVG